MDPPGAMGSRAATDCYQLGGLAGAASSNKKANKKTKKTTPPAWSSEAGAASY
jgi:hypothetical protein